MFGSFCHFVHKKLSLWVYFQTYYTINDFQKKRKKFYINLCVIILLSIQPHWDIQIK